MTSHRMPTTIFYHARKPAKKTISTVYPHLKAEIQRVQQEVLGWAPPSMNNQRSGTKFASRQLDGVYLNQYYTAHESIDVTARKVIKGWRNEQEQRRDEKLRMLRRKGKGPPKKGAKHKGKKKK